MNNSKHATRDNLVYSHNCIGEYCRSSHFLLKRLNIRPYGLLLICYKKHSWFRQRRQVITYHFSHHSDFIQQRPDSLSHRLKCIALRNKRRRRCWKKEWNLVEPHTLTEECGNSNLGMERGMKFARWSTDCRSSCKNVMDNNILHKMP